MCLVADHDYLQVSQGMAFSSCVVHALWSSSMYSYSVIGPSANSSYFNKHVLLKN